MAFPVTRHFSSAQRQNFARESFYANPRQDEKSSVAHDPLQVPSPLLISSRSTHPEPAFSRPAMSTAYRPTPDPEPAPSSADARRTARDIPGNGYVRPARATGGSRLD